MRCTFALIALAATFVATPLAAQSPHFINAALDLESAKQGIKGERTQMMTLASIHLSGYDAFRPDMMGLLLDRLERYRPTIITHEGLSGQQCEMLKNYPASYHDTFDTYCWDTDAARKATGLSVDQAQAAIEKTLSGWPVKPTASDRRKLALTFLAANDRQSAQVQWLRLQTADRIKADGIDDAMLAILNRTSKKMNESYDIAVALAVRLGLERVYAVDDHTSDSAVIPVAGEDYGKALTAIWNNPANKQQRETEDRLIATVKSPSDMLSYYRHINQPDVLRLRADADFLAAVKHGGTPNYGRMYAAWWETRNLRMVSNIRAASARYPGARVLNVVGASHKGYYDAYLNMMHDVEVIDVVPYLR